MDFVAIDVTRLFYRLFKKRHRTGIDRVILAFVANYANKYHAMLSIRGRCFLASKETSSSLSDFLQSYQSLSPLVFFKMLYFIIKIVSDHFRYKTVEVKYVFNLGHSGVTKRYLTQLEKHHLKLIAMIHDLIPLTNPEYCRSNTQIKYQNLFNRIFKYSHAIITTSNFNMDTIVSYCNVNRINIPICYVKHLPLLNLHNTIHTNRTVEENYFIVLGTIEPRKNHLLLLNVWKRLVNELGEKTPKLVIIGQRGWKNKDVINILENDKKIKNYVIELNDCSDQVLGALFRFTKALLFPSYIEGYGLPLIEALSNKVPVIASNLPVFKEISNGIPDFIDPYDENSWLIMIKHYLEEDSLVRKTQLRRMDEFNLANKKEYFLELEEWMKASVFKDQIGDN